MRFSNKLGLETKESLDETEELDNKIDFTNLVCVHTNWKIFDFNIFRRPVDFIARIYFDDISLEKAIYKQNETEYLVRNLEVYKPKKTWQNKI